MAKTIELERLDFASLIRAGETVTWGQASGEPVSLTERLMAQRHAIGKFNAFIGASYSPTPDPAFADCVRFLSYGGAGNNRKLAKAGVLDILPCHYSHLPGLLQKRVDVVLLQVSPPDAAGRFSFGLTHEFLISLIDSARLVIAEVNDQVPWVHGERTLDQTDIDVLVHTSRPPIEVRQGSPGETERTIAKHIAGLVEDESTLQLGIGTLPAAILLALRGHRDLGVHTGAFGDEVADLVEAGVITNARKSIDPGKIVSGFIYGTKRVFDFVSNNPSILMRSTTYTHDIGVLSSIDKLVALNSAIEVDLTGQINAEIAGGTYLGAIGGAADFLRGAARSKRGLPIVALQSRAGPNAKIVSRLSGPTSTSRADAALIVTEYGVADLRGLSLAERPKAMIAIAHPDDRERLEREIAL